VAGPGNILIKVGADAAQAVRELGTVDKALGSTMTTSERMGAGLKKAAIPAAAALTAIGIGAKKAIDAASGLNEQINKTSAVFGASGDAMVDWSKGLSKGFGLSSEAALEAAGSFGNMLVPMGFARDDAAKMSKQMVELAGDMASFNNASPEETLQALSSGLAGQSEPLRKYGVFLDQARIKQEAINQGLYSGKGAMDASAKAAATMAIILKDTADTQGDFARTADSAANQQRIAAAETANLTAELGQALLPAYQAIQGILINVIGLLSEHTGAVKVLVGAVAVLSAGILAANAAIKAYQALQVAVKVATAAWSAVQWLLNAALSANPIGLVIVAVAALTAGIILAYKNSETFRRIVTAAFDAVKVAAAAVARAFDSLVDAARVAFDWIKSHWTLIAPLFGPIGIAIALVVTHFDQLKAAAVATFDAIKSAIASIAGVIDSVIGAVERLIGALGRIHVPKINLPGPFMLPVPPTAGRGAIGPGAYATAPAGVTINVYGAIDPEGTARTIRKLLDDQTRRYGRR
jgi:phage-related protein